MTIDECGPLSRCARTGHVDALDHGPQMDVLFEAPMACPECGCRFCGNCFGALCDCPTVFYRHDVSHCDPVHTGTCENRRDER